MSKYDALWAYIQGRNEETLVLSFADIAQIAGTPLEQRPDQRALQILKQHSPDGKFPTMKDLRAEKEQLTIQKDAQYDTYRYFKDYHKELQTVCANVDSILGAEQKVQQHEQQHTRKYEPSL